MAAVIGLVLLPPLLWLALLQTDYVLAYAACADRTNAWLHKPNAVAIALGVVVLVASWALWVRSRDDVRPRGFLAAVGLGMSSMSFLLLLSMIIPPLILNPCD